MQLRNTLFFLFFISLIRLSAQNCMTPPSALQNGDFPATGTGNISSAPDVTIPYWWASHGTPTVRNDNAPGGSGRSIWMWSYSSSGEGIYSCFKFEQGKTYRVRLWAKNTNAINLGKLRVLAAGTFQGGGIPNPASYQVIDESYQFASSWTQIDVAFTAQSDFSRLLIYPFMSSGPIGGKQYELVVDKVEIMKVTSFTNLNLGASAQVVCEGEKVNLNIGMDGWDPNFIVSWYENTGNGPQLKETGSKQTFSFTARTTVTWTVRVTDPSDPSGNTFVEKDISITVLPAIELEHGKDTSICFGDSAVLIADGSSCKHGQDHLKFTWTVFQTGQKVGNGKVVKVSPEVTTQYQIHLQDTLTGHFRTGVITVDVDSRFKVIPRPDTTVCRGSQVLLDATVLQCRPSNSVTYYWQDKDGGPPLFGQQVDVSVSEDLDYLVTAVNQHGLMDTALVQIRIIRGPNTTLVGPDSLCLGDTIELELQASGGTGNYQVTWFGPNKMKADTGLKVRLPNGINGYYTSVTDDGCAIPSRDSIEIAFFPIPGAILETNFQSDCAPVQLNAWDKSYRHDPVKNEWLINNLHLPDSGDLDFALRIPGDYKLSLVVTSGRNCRDTFNYEDTLHVYPNPTAGFELSSDWEELLIPVQVFNQASGSDSLNWDFHTGHWEYFMGTDTLVFFEDTGTYSVYQIAYNRFGCVDTFYQNLKIIPPFQFFVPNAFSPNFDEHNPVFKPHTEGVKTYTMTIYNRWGGLVYTGVDGAWDGTYKGKAMADDVYMYVIQFTAFKGQRQTIKGNVTLIR